MKLPSGFFSKPLFSKPLVNAVPAVLSHSLASLENFTSPLLHEGFLGIDIGTSSLKIVQLIVEDGTVVLGTYGEIELGPYGDRDARKAVHLEPARQTAAILDLLAAVDATARVSGISIPLSSALISFVKMPKRDPEQMHLIIPIEAKQYVPVPLENVTLDWMVISDDTPSESAFARAESKKPVQSELQDVMLIAVENKTIESYRVTVSGAGISAGFYEVELFSSARACFQASKETRSGPSLLIDIGASTTKLSVINSRGLPAAVHIVPIGGQAITESIMQECDWHFNKAEDAKRAAGLTSAQGYTRDENVNIKKSSMVILTQLFTEASKIIEGAVKEHDVDVSRIILLGGGAFLPGIVEAATKHFKTPISLAEPFAHVRAPIILADVLHEVGPKFAVAMGLALRGAGK
jgi:type IV pilus assembly protein PilM